MADRPTVKIPDLTKKEDPVGEDSIVGWDSEEERTVRIPVSALAPEVPEIEFADEESARKGEADDVAMSPLRSAQSTESLGVRNIDPLFSADHDPGYAVAYTRVGEGVGYSIGIGSMGAPLGEIDPEGEGAGHFVSLAAGFGGGSTLLLLNGVAGEGLDEDLAAMTMQSGPWGVHFYVQGEYESDDGTTDFDGDYAENIVLSSLNEERLAEESFRDTVGMTPALTQHMIDESLEDVGGESLWSDLSTLFGSPKGYQGVVSGQIQPGYDAAMILAGSAEEISEEEPVNTVLASIASSAEASMLVISGSGPEGDGASLGIVAREGEGIYLNGPSTEVIIANLEEEDLDDPEKQDIVGMTPSLTQYMIDQSAPVIPEVPDYATKTEAEAGTNNTAIMTSLRVKQSIDKHSIQTIRAPEVGAGDPGWVLLEEYDRKSVELRSSPDPGGHGSAYSRFRWGVDLLNKAYLTIRVPDSFPGSLFWEGEQILTVATESQAVAGTENSRRMTSLRTKQAIDAHRPKHVYKTISGAYSLSAEDDNTTIIAEGTGYSIDVSGLPAGGRCWIVGTDPDLDHMNNIRVTGADLYPGGESYTDAIWHTAELVTVFSTGDSIIVTGTTGGAM